MANGEKKELNKEKQKKREDKEEGGIKQMNETEGGG